MASTTIKIPVNIVARASYVVSGGPRPSNCPVSIIAGNREYYLPMEAWGRIYDYLVGRGPHDENDNFIGHKVSLDIIASTTIKRENFKWL